MKCPKCGFNSFEYLDSCKKCGTDLAAFKMSLGLQPVIMPAAAFAATTAAVESAGVSAGAMPDVAADPSGKDDGFSFEEPMAASAGGEMPGSGQEFGEISFEETPVIAAGRTAGTLQGDGFSGQEFEGFATGPAPAVTTPLVDVFGTSETKGADTKTADDFFNSPELADLFKDDPGAKQF